MLNVVSFALWGKILMYTAGAIRNAKLVKEFYPGWVARFYCSKDVPVLVLDELDSLGGDVRTMKDEAYWPAQTKMFWRFLACFDPEVTRMVSRDCDSIPGIRESTAVEEWCLSGYSFHIMRDHPNHRQEILGGMWGMVRGAVPTFEDDMFKFIDSLPTATTPHWRTSPADQLYFGADQWFLKEKVWPHIIAKHMAHDDRKTITGRELPFKFPMRTNYDHVGNKYDASGKNVYDMDSR